MLFNNWTKPRFYRKGELIMYIKNSTVNTVVVVLMGLIMSVFYQASFAGTWGTSSSKLKTVRAQDNNVLIVTVDAILPVECSSNIHAAVNVNDASYDQIMSLAMLAFASDKNVSLRVDTTKLYYGAYCKIEAIVLSN